MEEQRSGEEQPTVKGSKEKEQKERERKKENRENFLLPFLSVFMIMFLASSPSATG